MECIIVDDCGTDDSIAILERMTTAYEGSLTYRRAYMAELLTGVFFIHRGLRIKTAPYYKVEDGQKTLIQMTPEGRKMLADYEAMLHGVLARKVKEDRIEKFENPAILLGLKNDGIL